VTRKLDSFCGGAVSAVSRFNVDAVRPSLAATVSKAPPNAAALTSLRAREFSKAKKSLPLALGCGRMTRNWQEAAYSTGVLPYTSRLITKAEARMTAQAKA